MHNCGYYCILEDNPCEFPHANAPAQRAQAVSCSVSQYGHTLLQSTHHTPQPACKPTQHQHWDWSSKRAATSRQCAHHGYIARLPVLENHSTLKIATDISTHDKCTPRRRTACWVLDTSRARVDDKKGQNLVCIPPVTSNSVTVNQPTHKTPASSLTSHILHCW